MTPSKFQREVMRYLKGIGATDIRIEPGGIHPRVVFSVFGKEWSHPLSISPSDINASKSAIRALAHLLGLATHTKTVGKRRTREYRAPKRPAACPQISTLPDYRDEILRALSPADLNFLAGLAWKGYWRAAMQSVGAESLI